MANADMSTGKVVTYHRRLDRTPEKNFEKLPEDSKVAISNTRRIAESVHKTINSLKDEIEDRDKVIEEERILRQSAEDRLKKCLVDLYESKEVNQELRDRLPRAGREDPLSSKDTDTEEETDSAKGESKEEEEEDLEIIEKQEILTQESAPCLVDADDSKRADKADLGDLDQQIVTDNTGASDMSRHASSGTSPPRRGTSPTHKPPLPYMSMHNPYLHQTHSSQSFSSPYQRLSPSFPLSQSYMSPSQSARSTASPGRQSEGDNIPLSVDDLSTEHSPNRKLSSSQRDQGESLPSARPSPPFPPLYNPYLHPPMMGGYYPGFMAHHHPPPPPSSASNASLPAEDMNKQNAILLAELDAERARNKKLTDRLAETELELETLKLSQQTRDIDKHEGSEAKKAADLVQEVHTSQRKRDEAVMNRIHVANQERDDAIKRLHHMERRLEDQGYATPDDSCSDEFDEEDPEEAMDKILHHLSDQDDASQANLVRRLEMVKLRRQEINAEEIQAIIDQRDAALAKASKLEEELLRQQRFEATRGTEQALRAKIQDLQYERDVALARIRHMQDEVKTSQIYKSLHKSLMEQNSKNDNEAQGGDVCHKEDNTTVAQLREAEHQRLQMEADFQKLEHAYQESQDKARHLDMMVKMLRRKLAEQSHSRSEEN